MKFGLEVGKYYRTAEGKVVGPLRIDRHTPDRFTDNMGNWYGEDGHFYQQKPNCPFRIVQEVKSTELYRWGNDHKRDYR